MIDESDEELEAEAESESEEEESEEEEPEIESEPEWFIIKDYRNNASYVRIEGAIINPNTLSRAPFSFECKIDTGFFGGLFYEASLLSDVELVNVQSRRAPLILADGTSIIAQACIANIEKINGYDLPYPGVPVELYMYGRPRGLMGMGALRSFMVLLDGPSERIKIGF